MVDANKVKENLAKMGNKARNSLSAGKVQPHKHCRICFTPIKLSSEPRVCKDQACIDKNGRDETKPKADANLDVCLPRTLCLQFYWTNRSSFSLLIREQISFESHQASLEVLFLRANQPLRSLSFGLRV